jgi:hypothetical protein
MVLLILLVGTLLGVLAGGTLCVHFIRFRAKTEMPTVAAELTIIAFSDQPREPSPGTFPEG